MAMALVRLQAVNNVPSRTLLLGAQVILMLPQVSNRISLPEYLAKSKMHRRV